MHWILTKGTPTEAAYMYVHRSQETWDDLLPAFKKIVDLCEMKS